MAIEFHHGRRWPWRRTSAWVAGIIAAASGFVGPLAAAGHDDFTAHMGAHVLVGMVAPLLLVAAAPVVAAVLNVGGMWALYRTPVFQAMQGDPLLHWLVMTHFLLAGYLFTAAIIPTDPAPHRAGYPLRMVVLVDIVIITMLCAQWYRTAGHALRRTRTSAVSSLRKERRVRW